MQKLHLLKQNGAHHEHSLRGPLLYLRFHQGRIRSRPREPLASLNNRKIEYLPDTQGSHGERCRATEFVFIAFNTAAASLQISPRDSRFSELRPSKAARPAISGRPIRLLLSRMPRFPRTAAHPPAEIRREVAHRAHERPPHNSPAALFTRRRCRPHREARRY